jgi:hypothetical protein
MPPRVVNMVPFANSAEERQDSEPNLAVNPSNPQQMAGSAFTPDPAGGALAPIYVSTDGGETWTLNLVVPSSDPLLGTGDITLRFGTTTNNLYAGILRRPAAVGLRLNILRTANFTAPTAMTVLVDRDTSPGPDQPYIQAATALGGATAGRDAVFVGTNDRPGTATRTSTVDWSLDGIGAAPPPPSGFRTRIVETRGTPSQDGFACRPAIHHNGTVYVAFLAWRTFSGGNITSDVVIVRDDNWASGTTSFSALSEPPAPAGDGLVGIRLARGITLPGGGFIGQTRLGSSMLTIAVDPRDHRNVYVAWCDLVGTTPTLHVRRSQNAGQNWGGDVRTIANAVNPALAINTRGKVGFLFQRLAGTAPNTRWETHLELTVDDWATSQDFVLADTPSNAPAPIFQPYLGDYEHLLTVGKNFYGVFSANNTPRNANFPQGVRYQRSSNFTTNQLFRTDGVTPVAVSIDPFFFRQTELAADADFYVRDWTDSTTSADTGLEPSTHPVFYVTSDVWNRQTDTPGGFNANDQPNSENPRNGPGSLGDNWAFARVHRAASGSPATVTLKFLVSPLGTGSNYELAGTGADPTLTFGSTELVKTMTNGRAWRLNAPMTTHVCLAVEISTAGDPIVAPSLLGRAPGWPTTDLAVLYDNNKAQRNLFPASGGSAGTVTVYALVHNAATWMRDVVLRFGDEPNGKRPRIRVIGGRGRVSRRRAVLPAMQPGENRWLSFTIESGAEDGATTMEEVLDNAILNGFAIESRTLSDSDFAVDTARYHASILWRLAEAFGLDELFDYAKRAFELAEDPKAYPKLLAEAAEQFPRWTGELVGGWEGGDPFRVRTQARNLTRIDPSAPEAAAAHASLLHALDAFATMRLKAGGDLADVLQTVEWLVRLLRDERLGAEENAEAIRACEHFVFSYSERRGNPDDYVELIKAILDRLERVARSADVDDELVDALRRTLGDPTALQRAHRQLLLALGEAVGAP